MVARRHPLLKGFLALLALIALICVTAGLWLPAMGRALIYDEGPAAADIAIVLAGDYSGGRILGAAQLARNGFVPAVLVSGPQGFYGINEADAAIRFATAQGYPAATFLPLRHAAPSTSEEAQVLVDELVRRNVHTFILVTSNFHTRRARRIFLETLRRRANPPAMRVIATPDRDYNPASWWQTRQGRKTAFLEWTKTVTSLFGI